MSNQFSYGPEPIDSEKLWLALIISICLHSAIFYLLPYLNREGVQPMSRIQVELNMTNTPVKSEKPPSPEPVVPETKPEEIVKPKPQPVLKVKPIKKIESTKPLLSSPEPAQQDDYVVPESAPQVTSEPTVQESPKSSDAQKPSSVPANPASSAQAADQHAEIEVASTDEAWEGYGKMLYDLVSKNKSYPAMAIRRNWEGQVKVKARFHLGKLMEITLMEESGREILDKQAIEMVRKAISQLPVKSGLAKKSFVVTIPVAFSLSNN